MTWTPELIANRFGLVISSDQAIATGRGGGPAETNISVLLDRPIGTVRQVTARALTPCPPPRVTVFLGGDGQWYAVGEMAAPQGTTVVQNRRQSNVEVSAAKLIYMVDIAPSFHIGGYQNVNQSINLTSEFGIINTGGRASISFIRGAGWVAGRLFSPESDVLYGFWQLLVVRSGQLTIESTTMANKLRPFGHGLWIAPLDWDSSWNPITQESRPYHLLSSEGQSEIASVLYNMATQTWDVRKGIHQWTGDHINGTASMQWPIHIMPNVTHDNSASSSWRGSEALTEYQSQWDAEQTLDINETHTQALVLAFRGQEEFIDKTDTTDLFYYRHDEFQMYLYREGQRLPLKQTSPLYSYIDDDLSPGIGTFTLNISYSPLTMAALSSDIVWNELNNMPICWAKRFEEDDGSSHFLVGSGQIISFDTIVDEDSFSPMSMRYLTRVQVSISSVAEQRSNLLAEDYDSTLGSGVIYSNTGSVWDLMLRYGYLPYIVGKSYMVNLNAGSIVPFIPDVSGGPGFTLPFHLGVVGSEQFSQLFQFYFSKADRSNEVWIGNRWYFISKLQNPLVSQYEWIEVWELVTDGENKFIQRDSISVRRSAIASVSGAFSRPIASYSPQ